MEIELNPKKIVWVLAGISAVLAILHIIACLPMFFMGRSYPLGFFSLDGEHNLPAIFSVALLWCSALLAGCIAWAGGQGRLNRIYWLGLALAFLVAGMDEAIMFHERLTEMVRQHMDATGVFHFAWVVPYAVLLLLLVVIYSRFFFALPADTRKHIALAAILYVGGAIGFEMLGGAWVESHGKDAIYYLLATIEELLEMSGAIAFIYAFTFHIGRHIPDLRLRITLKS